MATPYPMLAELSDAERTDLESWLVDFDLGWDPDRLPARVRQLPADGPLRRSALAEMIMIDLERQWQRGRRVLVEDYLREFPELGPPDDPPLDLVETEVEVRTEFGEPPDEAELYRRFPGCAAALLRRLPTPNTVAQAVRPTPGPGPAGFTTPRLGGGDQDLPERFGRYHILGRLGRGGMGAVYLAHDTQLDRRVALKVPHFSRGAGPEARERFRREGRAAAALDHPHLCRVYDVGEQDGAPYLTMAYVEGRPLGHPDEEPMPVGRAVELVRKVAGALAYAHARGVVHRDLKPSNILVDARGEPVVTDFGLAVREGSGDPRITQDGVPIGTPAYMSPEQVAGATAAIGPASDVFSLGVILYELLAGRLPFRGGPAEVMGRIVTENPPPPSAVHPGIDRRLDAACMKALAKEPAGRFASMDEFAAALAAAESPPRRRRLALAGAVLLLAVSVGAIVAVNLRRDPPAESPSPGPGNVGGDPGPEGASKPEVVKPGSVAVILPEKPPAVPLGKPPEPAKLSALTVFRGHDKRVTGVAFAPDGRVLSGGADGSVRLWDPKTGKEVEGSRRQHRGHEQFAFSPDGRRYVSHFLQPLEIFDAASGKGLLPPMSEGGPHTGMVAFAAKAQRLVVAKQSVSGVSAIVWDYDRNQTYPFKRYPVFKELVAVALSADGKQGLSAGPDGVRLWEVEAATELRHWKDLPAARLAFAPDGAILIGNSLGSLVLRDPKTGEEMGRFEGHTGAIKDMVFSPDGRLLLTASADGTARLWDAKTRRELYRLAGHDGEVVCAALAADGRRAATGGADGTVRLWEIPATDR